MATVPKTLFLRGVFLRDLVTLEALDSLLGAQYKSESPLNYSPGILSFDKSLQHSIDRDVNEQDEYYEIDNTVYDKVPKNFITLAEWPDKINIKCAQCALKILGPPVPIPKYMERNKDSRPIFDVSNRACCSFVCAASLITYTISNKSVRWSRLGMLKMIRENFYINGYSKFTMKNKYKRIFPEKINSVVDDKNFPENFSNCEKESDVNKNMTEMQSELEASKFDLNALKNEISIISENDELHEYGGFLTPIELRNKIWYLEFT